ncbi:MAG: PrgI family protein [Oscillospiraceae bacterium]|nr:PrgI family protein [Oscillospiraceae bacterium]
MLEQKIPAEIRAYKSKLIAGLSVRQVISLGLAILIGVPLGVFGRNYISTDILMWAIIIISAPILAWGFVTFQDMRFEEYAKSMLRFTFLPQKRVFENTEENCGLILRNMQIEEEIVQQRIASGEYEERSE